jgi:uncharacterized peroxidase-related enzyme
MVLIDEGAHPHEGRKIMTRIHTPASIQASPEASRPLLEAVNKLLGSVPNLFRVVGNSPAALEGYLALNGALAKGQLDAKTRERVALVVAEANGCDYCLAAHTFLGKNVAKLDDAEISENRAGGSSDPKASAAVRFAGRVVAERGHVTDDDVRAVRAAGFDDAQIVELVLHVALNTLTNYVNEVAKTVVDFPSAARLTAA